MKTIALFATVVMAFSGLNVEATPAQVIVLRHAEKIDDTNPNLSPRGQQRAAALVDFILTHPKLSVFGPPVAIFATEPRSGGSLRAIQTVTPLADKLGVLINSDFAKKEVIALVSSVLQNPKFDHRTVVISWVRDFIPSVVRQFGAHAAPLTWESNIFDRVWVLKWSSSGEVSFEDLPQHLLPGDSLN